MLQPESNRQETVIPMETVLFTTITKRMVLQENPSRIIDFLNDIENRFRLNPRNEYHFEVAQELTELYINMN